jgi:hypothetical protein
MFRRQSCAIFRELTVPDQICYTDVMDAKTGDSDSRCSLTRRCPVHFLSSLYKPDDDPDKGRNIVAKAKYIYTW